MKKFFTLLSLILAMFFFVSCGSDDDEDTTDTANNNDPTDTSDTTPADPADTGDTDTTPSDPTDTGDTTPSDPTDTGDTTPSDPTTPTDPTDPTTPAEPECEISNSFKISAYKDGEYYVFYGSGIVSDANSQPTVTKEGTYTSLYTEDIKNPEKTMSFITAGTVQGYQAHIVNTLVYDDETSKPEYQLEVIIWDDDYFQNVEEGEIIDHSPDVRITSIENYFASDGETLEATKFCIVAYSSISDDEDALGIGKFQYCNGDNGTLNVGQTAKFGIDAKLTSDMEKIQALFGVSSPEELCWCTPYKTGATCE